MIGKVVLIQAFVVGLQRVLVQMETIGYMDQKFEKLEGKTEVEEQVLWGNEGGVFEEKEVVLEETEGEWLGRGVEHWGDMEAGDSFLLFYQKSHLNPPMYDV